MQKDKILAEFDHLSKAKKQSSTNAKAALIFAFIVVVLVLIWGYSISVTALNKVVIVERSGEYLKTSTESNEDLFNALVQNTCAQTTIYTNSFDRLTLKRNQSKAAFYANTKDLNVIFAKYFSDKAYGDALQNGVVYKCEFEKITKLSSANSPFRVSFTSILNIYPENGNIVRFRIISDGELIKTTPQFPENVTGFFFNSLTQRVERMADVTANNDSTTIQ